MSTQVAVLERLIEKLPPGRARRRYETLLVEELHQQVAPTSHQDSDFIRSMMWERCVAFTLWAAEIYEARSPEARQAAFPQLLIVHDQIDAAYRHADGQTVQLALVGAKQLFDQRQQAPVGW